MMFRAARLALVSLAAVSFWCSPGRAEFCDDLDRVADVAAADNLASLGVGPAYTGPAIAGHVGEFPSDDTQNTTLRIAGAAKCGLNALPQLGTRFYSCDLPGGIEVWKSKVSECSSSTSFKKDSDGVSGRLGNSSIYLAEYDPGVTRIEVTKWADPQDEADYWADEPSSGSQSASTAQVDCEWLDAYTCMDRNSIQPGGDRATYRIYMCWTRNVGPPNGRCDQPWVDAVDCTTGQGYHGDSEATLKADETKMDLTTAFGKRLCPSYDASAGAKDRCLKKYLGDVASTDEQRITACTQLIDAAPRSADSWSFYRERGQLYLDAKRFEDAIGDYTQWLAVSGDDSLAYGKRAMAYAALRKYEPAMADISKAIAIDSKGPYGEESPASSNILATWLTERAEIYIRAKRYEEAVADAQRVITSPTAAADAYYLLSVAERALGRTPMADADLARARTLWPDVEDVYSEKLQPDPPSAPRRKSSKR